MSSGIPLPFLLFPNHGKEEAEARQLGVPKPDESTRTHSDQFSHQERRPWTKKSQVDRQILLTLASGP